MPHPEHSPTLLHSTHIPEQFSYTCLECNSLPPCPVSQVPSNLTETSSHQAPILRPHQVPYLSYQTTRNRSLRLLLSLLFLQGNRLRRTKIRMVNPNLHRASHSTTILIQTWAAHLAPTSSTSHSLWITEESMMKTFYSST